MIQHLRTFFPLPILYLLPPKICSLVASLDFEFSHSFLLSLKPAMYILSNAVMLLPGLLGFEASYS